MELSEVLNPNATPSPHSDWDISNMIPQNTPNMSFGNVCLWMTPPKGSTSWNKDKIGPQDKDHFYPQSHGKQRAPNQPRSRLLDPAAHLRNSFNCCCLKGEHLCI